MVRKKMVVLMSLYENEKLETTLRAVLEELVIAFSLQMAEELQRERERSELGNFDGGF